MSNPVGFNELFNFDDTTPINKAIELIEKLNTVYDKLVEQSTRNSQEYADSISQILTNAKKLEDQIKGLDATEKAHQETIIKTSAEAEKLIKKNEQYTKAAKEEEAQLAALTEMQKKLKSAKEKLGEEYTAEAGSLNDLKKQLKEATEAYYDMGEATDQAVKDESLKKIEDLSKKITEGEEAFKKARKAVNFAAGSYYELNQRVVDAKKRLKEMEGGIGSNTEEFKELQAFVKKGSDELKEFDKAIGDNQRNVGNYESAFNALDGQLGGVIGRTKELGQSFLALAANPVVLTLAVIVGLLAAAGHAVKTFFSTTAEGEDMLEEQSAVWDAFFIELRKGWSDIGEAITDFFGGAEDGAASLNFLNGAISALGVTIPALIPFLESFRAKFNKTAEESVALTKAIDDLEERLSANFITRAQNELDAAKLLEQSKNKLLFTDEQRLQFLKEAVKIQNESSNSEIGFEKEKLSSLQRRLLLERKNVDFLKEGIQFDAVSLDLLKENIKSSGLLQAEKDELAQAVAKVIELETQYYQQQKRNTSQISALELEIEKAKRDRLNRAIDAQNAYDKYILEAEAKRNDEIVKDEDATLAERLDALNNAATARIAALEIEKENELNAVRRAAEERIRAEGKVVTEQLLAQDEALQSQRELIGEKYVDLIEDVNRRTLEAVETNVFTQLKKDAADLNADTQTIYNELGRAAEVAFKSGNISVRQLLQERKILAEDSAREALVNQINSLEEQKKAIQKYGHDVSAIDQQISAARLALARSTNEELIAGHQKVKDAAVNLAMQSFQSASDFINASAERNIMALEERLIQEEDAKNRSLAIVGDDAQARAFIEEQSLQKQKAIQAEINKEKRKAAIYDKAISITQATVNTALGVSRALGSTVPPLNFILAALVGAAGALQIASIAAAPIPAFAMGTTNAPEGWALVGEAGRELIYDKRSGSTDVADGPQFRYLSAGSIVVPNKPTEQLLKDARAFGDGYLVDQVVGSYDRSSDALGIVHNALQAEKIVAALGATGSQIVSAISKQPRQTIDEQGFRTYEQGVAGRIVRLDRRYSFDD
jgi:hypothetical protein